MAARAAAPAYDVLLVRSLAENLLPNTADLSRGDGRARVRIMAARQGVVMEPSADRGIAWALR